MSIKKKFATAVATAGLLAGLFGSAFVPAAKGAAVTPAADSSSLACVATTTDADVEVAGDADGVCYAAAGTNVTVTVTLSDGTPADDEQYLATNIAASGAGAQIVSFDLSDVEFTLVSIASGGLTADFRGDNAGDAALSATIVVKAPAAGATATYALYTGTTLLGDLDIVGIAAGTGNTPNATKSVIMAPCYALAFVDDDAVAANDAVSASAANNVVKDINGNQEAASGNANTFVAAGGALCADSLIPAVAVSGTYIAQYQLKDASGAYLATPINGTSRATVTGPGGVNLIDDMATVAATADSATRATDTLTTDDGIDYVGVKSNGTPGTVVVTITTGSVTFSRSIVFLGGISSIAITGPTHMTTDDSNTDTAFYDKLGVTCKDSAGAVIGDGGGDAADGETAGYYIDGDLGACQDDNLLFEVLNADGSSVASFLDDDDEAARVAAGHAAYTFSDNANGAAPDGAGTAPSEARNGYWDIPAEICEAGKEGLTRTLKVSSGVIASNSLSLTCVSDTVKITSITALTTGTSGSASGGNPSQTIKYSVAATDGYGRPAGTGAAFTFALTRSWTTATTTSVKFNAGTSTITLTLPTNGGAQYVIWSATDGDTATTGAQGFSSKHSFTVTNPLDALTDYVLTKSGAKVTGSNFAARATVKVEVENATKGTVKVFTRKASASGTVTYTVAGSGTFYVTMYTGTAGNEVLSNTVTVKR